LNILIDAMGGDNAPLQIIKGCIDAINEDRGFDITLIGDQDKIHSILSKETYDKKRIIIKHAGEIISGDATPTTAIKKKKEVML
jgi:glycerol-3-phosphate acyltransferase PlsX